MDIADRPATPHGTPDALTASAARSATEESSGLGQAWGVALSATVFSSGPRTGRAGLFRDGALVAAGRRSRFLSANARTKAAIWFGERSSRSPGRLGSPVARNAGDSRRPECVWGVGEGIGRVTSKAKRQSPRNRLCGVRHDTPKSQAWSPKGRGVTQNRASGPQGHSLESRVSTARITLVMSEIRQRTRESVRTAGQNSKCDENMPWRWRPDGFHAHG